MADAGYDVADYRDDRAGVRHARRRRGADRRGARARACGCCSTSCRTTVSDQHPWFQAALAAPRRARRSAPASSSATAAGRDGEPAAQRLAQQLRRPAWTRVTEADGRPGQWYLHLFAPEQPDLDWTNPRSAPSSSGRSRFWFDRGVDGFRIDVAHGLVKAAGLPDVGSTTGRRPPPSAVDHPHWDRDGVHEIYRALARARRRLRRRRGCSSPRRGCTTRSGWRGTSARTSCTPRSTSSSCWRRGERDGAARGDRGRARRPRRRSARRRPGCCPTTTWSARCRATRGRRTTGRCAGSTTCDGLPADLELGRRRARAAALLMLALPGGAYVYQGEELGLPEVEDLPDEVLQDPVWEHVGAHRARPRRLPGADPVVGRRAAVRVQPERRGGAAVAAAAGRLGGADRRGADRRPRLDAGALPRARWRSGTSAPRSATGRSSGSTRPRARWRSGAATGSRAWSTSPPSRWRRRPERRCCWSALR